MIDETKKIIRKLPYWFQAKHLNESSTTKDFLNVFGETIEDTKNSINRAYELCDLKTFSNKDYIVHKIFIDSFERILINNSYVIQFDNDKEFVNSIGNQHGYYFDYIHGILYISNLNDNDTILIDGHDYKPKVISHRIWNADLIDEYGLLYDMPRNINESNYNYRNRLYEYSMTLAKSTFHGICSYIGHYTDRYKIVEWVDGSKDIKLFDDTICNYIFVDNKPFFNVERIDNDTIIIKGDIEYKGVSRKIKYFYMFNVETLINYLNTNKTYNSNFTPNEEFLKLFNDISMKCPIMWSTSRWGESYWLNDINNDEYYHISPTFDPDISMLKNK